MFKKNYKYKNCTLLMISVTVNGRYVWVVSTSTIELKLKFNSSAFLLFIGNSIAISSQSTDPLQMDLFMCAIIVFIGVFKCKQYDARQQWSIQYCVFVCMLSTLCTKYEIDVLVMKKASQIGNEKRKVRSYGKCG